MKERERENTYVLSLFRMFIYARERDIYVLSLFKCLYMQQRDNTSIVFLLICERERQTYMFFLSLRMSIYALERAT